VGAYPGHCRISRWAALNPASLRIFDRAAPYGSLACARDGLRVARTPSSIIISTAMRAPFSLAPLSMPASITSMHGHAIGAVFYLDRLAHLRLRDSRELLQLGRRYSFDSHHVARFWQALVGRCHDDAGHAATSVNRQRGNLA